jgi:hypothetical protein
MKIDFIPSSQEVFDYVAPPVSAISSVPSWYKKIKPVNEKNLKFDHNSFVTNVSLKQCMPFLDSLTAGYIQETWCDIYITYEKEKISYNFANFPEIINIRQQKNIPHFKSEFYPLEFVWLRPWIPKTPKGYSILVVHPLNRFDLPFNTISGIIDSDELHHTPFGKTPFYIKNEFHGIIPKGTPMFQMIPFKRDNWEKSINKYNEKEINKRHWQRNSVFSGRFYKNNFWNKKQYN